MERNQPCLGAAGLSVHIRELIKYHPYNPVTAKRGTETLCGVLVERDVPQGNRVTCTACLRAVAKWLDI